MPGCDYYVSMPQLVAARAEYEAGWSAHAISCRHWQEWGYSCVSAAERGLRRALASLGVETRSRTMANEQTHLLHGDTRRAFRDPSHPEHHRYLAYHARRRMAEKAAKCGVQG